MRARLWKWTSMIGVGAALMIVYRELRERAILLRQAATDDDRLTETIEDSFPASDPGSYTPVVGARGR